MQAIQSLLLFFLFFSLISILWSTIRYGISPMPSNPEATQAMLSLTPPKPKLIFELGSGWGNLAYALALKHPSSMIYGYEMSLLPYLFSRLFYRRDNLVFERKDFLNASYPPDSLLVCYLYPEGMKKLAQNENMEGCWMLSNTFALPKHPKFQELEKLQLQDLYRSWIYLYRIH